MNEISLLRRQWLRLMAGAAALSCSPVLVRQVLASGGRGVPVRSAGCMLLDRGESVDLLLQTRLAKVEDGSLLEGSGDARLDRALGTMLADLAGRFEVRPGFGFYDDLHPNALALPDTRLPHSQGTVLFGRRLFERGMRGTHGDVFVMGICAHEFAHIVQFSGDYEARLTQGQSTHRLIELHADFLSGYYMGLRARDLRYSARELVALGQSWETLGDSHYTETLHHGTAEERLKACEAGFTFARERPEFRIQAACEVGARYLGV